MAYVSRREHALVDVRLYLPKEWANDRVRRKRCGVPKKIRHRTRQALALEMLETTGRKLPHGWIAGDDEMGRSSRFRRDLRALGERYLLAVPSNTGLRDREAPPPAYGGRGRPGKPPFQRVDRWAAALAPDAWTRIDVRDGEKGPLVLEIATTGVVARTERSSRGAGEELLVVTRSAEANGTSKYDYYLSNACGQTPRDELARVVNAEHRVEEGLKRAKSEAGLSDYEVRTWAGWHHHQTLSLMATWFLIGETRRGKKIHPGPDRPTTSRPAADPVASGRRPYPSRLGSTFHETQKQPPRIGPVPSLQTA
jgi:SRSO17 transposase